MITLLTGGARSGKSSRALLLAQRAAAGDAPDPPGRSIAFVATARPLDGDLTARIRAHQAERGPAFQTFERPLDLSDLPDLRRRHRAVILDCLTVWVGNLLCDPAIPAHLLDPNAPPDHAADAHDRWIEDQISALCRALRPDPAPDLAAPNPAPCPIFLVTNEVGLGIVPGDALSRRYRDGLGRCNQRIAALADRVEFLVCGLPMTVKPVPP